MCNTVRVRNDSAGDDNAVGNSPDLRGGSLNAGRFDLGFAELEAIAESAREVIQPTIYGQAVIVLVYVPLLGFSGVEGKTFLPMALTVIIALGTAFILSLTFVPAMLAVALGGNVQERENRVADGLKAAYRPVLGRVIETPAPILVAAVILIAGATWLFTRPARPIPTSF